MAQDLPRAELEMNPSLTRRALHMTMVQGRSFDQLCLKVMRALHKS